MCEGGEDGLTSVDCSRLKILGTLSTSTVVALMSLVSYLDFSLLAEAVRGSGMEVSGLRAGHRHERDEDGQERERLCRERVGANEERPGAERGRGGRGILERSCW